MVKPTDHTQEVWRKHGSCSMSKPPVLQLCQSGTVLSQAGSTIALAHVSRHGRALMFWNVRCFSHLWLTDKTGPSGV